MKNLSSVRTFSTAAVFLMAALAACGRNMSAGTTGMAAASGKVDWSKHEIFTAWLWSDQNDLYASYSDNPVVWALNKKFNVTLRYEEPVRGTEADSLSLMFGTGEYTDMIEMSMYSGSIRQLYDDGIIVNIADYLDYMPNFKKLLETDEGFRRTSYDDDGHIFTLHNFAEPEMLLWGGLVYRHDILEKQTGGTVKFPGGGDYPMTIEDWEYMLPLFKQHFEAAGITDYAPLILPYNGVFAFCELANGFGAYPVPTTFCVEGGVVKSGIIDNAFFTYLKKMREWYAKGYIYKDFASRVNDPFYLSNPALTYGGMAGIWWGLADQLGDSMSVPMYGMYFDVRALPSPLSTVDSVTETANFQRVPYYMNGGAGYAFSKTCKNLPKLLSVMDYCYSKEGGLLKAGLTKETGSAENPVYIKAGVQDGFYWYEDSNLVVNQKAAASQFVAALNGQRLPGIDLQGLTTTEKLARQTAAGRLWDPYPNAKIAMLRGVSLTSEEAAAAARLLVQVTDYFNSKVPQFIMGTAVLDDRAWADFKARLNALGLPEIIRINQAAYDRYLKR